MESTHAPSLRAPLFVLWFVWCATGWGMGAWWKEGPVADKPAWRGFSQPAILKRAIFSRTGHLRWVGPPPGSATCEKAPAAWAWVTHRLSPGETLSADTGRAIGKALGVLEGCFSAVELNIEPMPAPPDWLVPFLSAVRTALPDRVALRTAVPAVTTKPLVGPSWRPDAAMRVLEAVDGIDLMLYDTGERSPLGYLTVLSDAGELALRSGRGPKGPRALLGIPAYADKTDLHDRQIESLSTVMALLPKLPESARRGWCYAEVAVYAGWTATDPDVKQADAIRQWRANGCPAIK